MKFVIEKKKLYKIVSLAQKAVSSRNTMEILDGLLITVENDYIKICGTDLDISIESKTDCKVLEEGSTVVKARLFSDLVRNLPDGDVSVEINDTNLNIKCGKSKARIMCVNPKEFPDLPIIMDENCLTLSSDDLRLLIKSTSFATTLDETRPTLTGVLFENHEAKLNAVALDGYRLALKTIDMNSEAKVNVIIPARTLDELFKILPEEKEDIVIRWNRAYVVFEIDSTTIYSRLIQGQFFNYREIIASDFNTVTKVKTAELKDAVERAALIAKDERVNLIKITIEDDKLLINSNSDLGEIDEEMDIENSGNKLTIAFNSRYLIQGLRAFNSEYITLNMIDNVNPCIMKPTEDDSYLYLVLPVRLSGQD